MIDRSMAERVAPRVEKTPQQPMAEKKVDWEKRKFLGKVKRGAIAVAAVGALGSVGAILGHNVAQSVGRMETNNAKNKFSEIVDSANEWIVGDIKISKKAKPRTLPVVPTPNEYAGNETDWSSVVKVNDENVRDIDSFLLKNVPVVKEEWIPVKFTYDRLGIVSDEIVYFHRIAGESAGTIIPDRDGGTRFKNVTSRDANFIYFDDSSKLAKSDIGLVKVNPPQE